MKILVTGSNGVLARVIIERLKPIHSVIATNRITLDVLRLDKVKYFFDNNEIEVVIHTAINGGRRVKKDNVLAFYENLLMFENLQHVIGDRLFINLGSGAEFDTSLPIDCMLEGDIFSRVPKDFYGLSKNIIAKRLYGMSNAINLRIFGCFGATEDDGMVKTALVNSFFNKPIFVLDKWMDFIYVEDFCTVIEWCINNIKYLPKSINCVYKDKSKLEDIARYSQEITGVKNEIIIQDIGNSYTGGGDILNSLNLPLIGVYNGMERMFNSLNLC